MVKELFEKIYVIEYPNSENLFNGIPINHGYDYISSTFCNGLVNYIEDKQLVLINRYKEEEFDDLVNKFVNQSEQDWYHTDLNKYGDDIFVFGVDSKTNPSSYILIWFDCDVSDCCIYRFDINDFGGMHHFIELMKKWLENLESINNFKFIQRKPNGWIKF